GPPHHLHSFPTRRSSDLKSHLILIISTDVFSTLESQIPQGHHSLTYSQANRLYLVELKSQLNRHLLHLISMLEVQMGKFTSGTVDRKSTRLNSSHVKISY